MAFGPSLKMAEGSSNSRPDLPHASVTGGELLAEITAGLSAGDDLDNLLNRFLDSVVRVAGAQAGAVRILGSDASNLQGLAVLGLPAGTCAELESVDRHCGTCGRAADRREPVWAEDLSTCTVANNGRSFGDNCQRMLAVPLQHRGQVLGVYNLFFGAHQPEPTPELGALLRSVGELLGLALNHARLEQSQAQAAVLRERQLMAAEVHDSLGQSLTFVKMRLPLLEDALRASDTARALRYCAELRANASQAHTSLRTLLTHLRAPMHPQGLQPALRGSAEAFRRQSSTELDFVNELPTLSLGAEREAEVFHIVQEALANVARHASARHAWLHIGRSDDGAVQIRIEDDGRGLGTPSVKDFGAGSHYGLQIMQERASRLGAALDIGDRQGGGTRIQLRIPHAAAVPGGL